MALLSYDSTGVVCGPSIPLRGLSVCYDFSNLKSYPGSGNTVYDISGNGINAALSGSGASRPTLVSDGGKSYMLFTSASEHFMYYTLPTWGTSYTVINVYASPSTLWDNIGDIGGVRWDWEGATVNNTNGFTMFPITNPPFVEQSGSGFSVEYKSSVGLSVGANYFLGSVYPFPQTNPHLYFYGYDHSTGNILYGCDSIRNELAGSPLTGRGARNNTRVYFSRIDERYAPTLTRFTSLKLYMHLLYDRKLSTGEIRGLYDSIKTRFNI